MQALDIHTITCFLLLSLLLPTGGSYTMSVYEINDPGYPTPAPTPAPMTIIGDGYIGCYADDQNNRVRGGLTPVTI